MANSLTFARTRQLLLALLLMFTFGIVTTVAIGALLARQQGLGITAAVPSALHYLLRILPSLLLIYGFTILFYLLLFRRRPTEDETPIEAGCKLWLRMRIWLTVGIVPFLLITAGVMIYHLVSGHWQDLDWLLAFMWILYAIVLLAYWVRRMSRESMYTLATGDTSRIDDERSQQLQGKAANTTLTIFMLVLLTVGILYETIVQGTWPVLTVVEFIVLMLIWTIATTYWNRRL